MIRNLADLTLANGLGLVYGAIASAVAGGAVLGVLALWVGTAARGGR